MTTNFFFCFFRHPVDDSRQQTQQTPQCWFTPGLDCRPSTYLLVSYIQSPTMYIEYLLSLRIVVALSDSQTTPLIRCLHFSRALSSACA